MKTNWLRQTRTNNDGPVALARAEEHEVEVGQIFVKSTQANLRCLHFWKTFLFSFSSSISSRWNEIDREREEQVKGGSNLVIQLGRLHWMNERSVEDLEHTQKVLLWFRLKVLGRWVLIMAKAIQDVQCFF